MISSPSGLEVLSRARWRLALIVRSLAADTSADPEFRMAAWEKAWQRAQDLRDADVRVYGSIRRSTVQAMEAIASEVEVLDDGLTELAQAA